MEITRRRLVVTGAAALLCAPAIVRVASLMPVKVQPTSDDLIKAMLDEIFERTGRELQRAFEDALFYGTGTVKVGGLHDFTITAMPNQINFGAAHSLEPRG